MDDVILYTSYLHSIGGIETFVLNFIKVMGKYYKIGLCCPSIHEDMVKRLEGVTVYQKREPIECDTLIMIRYADPIPPYVTYKKSIRMCHATKSNFASYIRNDCDRVVHVSNASRDTFESNGDVIYNPVVKSEKKALLFVSATRIPAMDKGKNADRILQLARMLNSAKVPFVWFNFSDQPLPNAPKGFCNVGIYEDCQPFIAKADYLVQLSDYEGFGFSVAEALVNNTAVICTPFSTTEELGVKDGENGYIIPFDFKDYDVTRFMEVPKFEYHYDNQSIVEKWKKLLNRKTLRKKVKGKSGLVRVKIPYFDISLEKTLQPGMVLEMPMDRVELLVGKGFVERVE